MFPPPSSRQSAPALVVETLDALRQSQGVRDLHLRHEPQDRRVIGLPSYASRILRLTLLAPDIVKAVLDRRQPAEFQLDDLLNGFPLEWEGQPSRFG
jgi:hypothetical protein